jgi:hypothetical protein
MDKITKQDINLAVQLLNKIPDKSAWKTTTSTIFKLNMLQEFTGKTKLRWIELGSAQGHTTQILSILAKKVTAIDCDPKNISIIDSLGCNNVKAMIADLYTESFKKFMNSNEYDACLIDAVHKEANVICDIKNCLSAGVKTFVFDDYGGFPGVKKAVDTFILKASEKKALKNHRFVGLPPSTFLENTSFKILSDWEGMIVELKKQMDWD